MILLDANVLLELLITDRSKKHEVLDWLDNNTDSFCISMLTVHLVLHFGVKDGQTLPDIMTFLADYPKIGLLPEDYVSAMELLADRDHEDALQLAVAKRAGCTGIVTLDKKFATNYQHKIKFTVLGE